ncbi:NERD domain-containing protein/DEAD/DEAH box helicase [Azotobacter beijerinckii]|uniref:NERD domain-containing protein/DEAD/DEAH box helicase n=1 Tax=Azotobacter beijerinckii TaxID=170623 RepID=UPI00295421C4|nr:NERD domain-containing protein/DEAD/DEAH box helicase [Azotobacter beijerinckii]MDV7210976.1 NERD domain-containing protein/DEAD/DEAH box helicase [Azotobacter beijerinckii]
MAQFFPARSACRFDTPGERRLAERLEKKLEDDYLCWFNVPVGPKALQPDFVVLHPRRGVLVLEVKDWKLETIQSMDRGKAQILDGGRLKSVANPMTQARVYALEVAVTLQKDPALKQAADSPHAGKLAMPYGWGVVLAGITRKQFEATELAEVLDPQRVICQDEMGETVEPEAFQQRLWEMFHQVFPCRLSSAQIDRVRYHLYPEVRVNTRPGQFGLFAEEDAPLPSLIKVMDLQQEQLARSLGEGHRVIHGPAGSGKTMILGYRCAHLAQAASKPILVLCFNKSLAGRLQQLMDERGLGDKVRARNFHAWCRGLLVEHQQKLPPQNLPIDKKMALMVDYTIDGVEQGRIPGDRYAAVLIDEGHDFEPDWFRLAVRMLDPESRSLLVLYDDAQAIYRGKGGRRGLDFSFASVGIQAQGRTTVLKVNYRNTLEVLSVARAFASDLLTGREAGEDGVPVVAPESAGRRGPLPELLPCESDWQEWNCIVERLRDEQGKGRSLSDMAVIYRSNAQARQAERVLTLAGLPFASGVSSQGRGALYGEEDAVKIVSMHSSKGLEFGLVLIPGLGELPTKGEEEADEARLLYVAMTRATDRLIMTCRGDSAFGRRVREAIGGVRERLEVEG